MASKFTTASAVILGKSTRISQKRIQLKILTLEEVQILTNELDNLTLPLKLDVHNKTEEETKATNFLDIKTTETRFDIEIPLIEKN